jgi:hypothetical protein
MNFYEDINTIDIFYNRKDFTLDVQGFQGFLMKSINSLINASKFRESKNAS